jgi:hypothetical protein
VENFYPECCHCVFWYLILVLNMAHEVEIAGVEVIFSLMMQINFRIGASNFMYHYPILSLH